MTKKYLFILGLTFGLLSIFVGCNKPAGKNASGKTGTENKSEANAPLRIAVVNLDSVYTKYQYYLDITASLEQKAKDNAATLDRKVTSLQKQMVAFQEKLQKGGFVSETAARMEQERIMKQEQQDRMYGQRLSEQFMQESKEANDKLYTTIQEEIAKFNETHKYDLILTDIGIENVLYYGEQFDVTEQVIEHLNKAYQASKEK